MRTQELIRTLEDLIARNQVELAISLMRKMLKVINKDLYHQILQVSASHIYQKSLRLGGSLSIGDEMRSRGFTTHSLLEVLENMEKTLPEELSEDQAMMAAQLLAVIEPEPDPIDAIGHPSPPVHKRKQHRLNARLSAKLTYGMVLILAVGLVPSFFLFQHKFLPPNPNYERFIRHQILHLADNYGLTAIDGLNAHLAFGITDLNYWHERVRRNSLGPQDLESEFATLRIVIRDAENEGREIFTRDDLNMLAKQYVRGP